jgi:hypothetical protein
LPLSFDLSAGRFAIRRFSVRPHCSEGFSLATHTANSSRATGSMPAPRSVSRTKQWRSFPAFNGTSAIAANSVFNVALAAIGVAGPLVEDQHPGEIVQVFHLAQLFVGQKIM